MEDTGGERILSLCGYLDFVQKRTRQVARLADDRRLCDACARESSAKYSVDDAPLKKA